jgi:hypothetical protein
MENRTKLESSNLHSAAWENGVLEIAFKNPKTGEVRAVWQYSAPKEAYDGLITAESAGKFFNSSIKGLYDGHRVDV